MASNDITTATASPQAFVFPGTAEPSRELVVPPAPASTTSTELVKVVVGKTIAEAQQTLDCYAILSRRTRSPTSSTRRWWALVIMHPTLRSS